MVEVLAQGSKEQIETLIKCCKKGVFLSEVKNVTVDWSDLASEFNGFEIAH